MATVSRLTTNRNATVTASAGAQSADLEVTLGARLISSVTPSPAATTVGAPVTFSIVSPDGANISDATINFGDGRSQSLGSFAGTTTASHAYSSPGAYTVTVTARDALGTTQTQNTSVTIGTLPLTLSASPNPAAPNSPVTFTAGGTGGTQVGGYRWTFGDGAVDGHLGATEHALLLAARHLYRARRGPRRQRRGRRHAEHHGDDQRSVTGGSVGSGDRWIGGIGGSRDRSGMSDQGSGISDQRLPVRVIRPVERLPLGAALDVVDPGIA